MSKENAQQILDALLQDEKNAQDKAKKQPVRGSKKADKDW
jgi:Ca-activated chloride channel family protein